MYIKVKLSNFPAQNITLELSFAKVAVDHVTTILLQAH